MSFKKGDRVYYVGWDQRLKFDYGAQELVIDRIDYTRGHVVCRTIDNRVLVGVKVSDLQFPA